MAEMTIRLRCDPETGKKEIIVTLRSDEDALPHEHEQMHQNLVEKLMNKGVMQDGDKVIVEREEEEKAPAAPAGSGAQDQRQAQIQGR